MNIIFILNVDSKHCARHEILAKGTPQKSFIFNIMVLRPQKVDYILGVYKFPLCA
jgi:hypothetical protein